MREKNMDTFIKRAIECKTRLRRVTADAQLAFWQEVIKGFPEVKKDLNPLATSLLDKRLEEIVGEWFLANFPPPRETLS
jgi:hypothetical protein